MKKSDELRLRTRKLLAKNLIILVALAVIAIVGAFSWFSHTTTASAGTIVASTKANDALEYFIVEPKNVDQYSAINSWIATYNTNHASDEGHVDKKWHLGEWTFDFSDAELKFMNDLYLSEVTSDGLTFKIPKLNQYRHVAYVNEEESFSDAAANENYMSFDIYFRCKRQYTIVLKSDSSIAPMGQIDPSTEVGMQNGAIGAVRMSVQDVGNTNARELLWIPGPGVWFDGMAPTQVQDEYGVLHLQSDSDWDSLTNRGKSITYLGNNTIGYTNTAGEDTDNHVYYTASGVRTLIESDDTNVIASTDYDDHPYELGHDITVCTLGSNNHTSGEYYYGYVRVNLWIEGEDSEARVNFVKGKFSMDLDFDIEVQS